jgi:hypothetical protein
VPGHGERRNVYELGVGVAGCAELGATHIGQFREPKRAGALEKTGIGHALTLR